MFGRHSKRSSSTSTSKRLRRTALKFLAFATCFVIVSALAIKSGLGGFGITDVTFGRYQGAGVECGFFMLLVFFGLPTLLLLPDLWDAWREYRLEKNRRRLH
jgi:hypothetical protein